MIFYEEITGKKNTKPQTLVLVNLLKTAKPRTFVPAKIKSNQSISDIASKKSDAALFSADLRSADLRLHCLEPAVLPN